MYKASPESNTGDDINPTPSDYQIPSYEYLADKDFSEKLKHTALVVNILQTQKEEARRNATRFAENTKEKWAGREVTDFLGDLETIKTRALKSVGLEHDSEVTPEIKQKIVREMIEKMRGMTAEKASATTPLNEAETVYISIDNREDEMKQIGKYKQQDISERFGNSKKDIILAGLKLAPRVGDLKFSKEVVDNTAVSYELAEKAIQAVAEVFLNYESERKAYESETGFEKPKTDDLIFRNLLTTLQKSNPEKIRLNKKEKAAVRYIVSWAYEESGRQLLDYGKGVGVAEKVFAELEIDTAGTAKEQDLEKSVTKAERARKFYDESYHNITLPDAYLGDAGKISGAVEVKMYTTKEITQWIKWLKQADEIPEDLTAEKREPGEIVIANGLQVTHYSVAEGTRTYGPDIEAERNFARLNNGDEKSRIPIILRLPGNVKDSQISELVKIAEEKGITNFVVQRMPFTVNHVHSSALNIVRNTLLKQVKPNTLNAEILNELAQDKTWGFE